MSTFALEIVTPTKTVDQGEVTYIRCPGADGLFGVMAGHTPGLFALSAGEIGEEPPQSFPAVTPSEPSQELVVHGRFGRCRSL